ncbi:MAG TPA: aminodeoxychorismate/anthranilate synthase component II [Thermoanaerobaculia bacterium]|jgi:anthranilate synthase/aminodeoxychorismate synthase-like glutamine amidotransferase
MILLIDNYDSFTYNLVQLLREAEAEVTVVRNDVEDVDALLARSPRGLVLSPGPGRPEHAGVCIELLRRRPAVPVLGVCLGHQCLGAAFGAVVGRAPELVHGKTSRISFRPDELFEGLPNPFDATRYHSLAVPEESVPRELKAIAWTDDGTVMAIRHRELPYWGVQFHPESVLTPVGPTLLKNFLRLCGLEGEPALAGEPVDRRKGPADRRR